MLDIVQLVWAVTTIAATLFLMWYGRRIKRNPELSPVYEIDQARREQLKESENEHIEFTTRHKIILSLILFCLAGIVVGVLNFDFGIPEIAALFLVTGIVSGLLDV